jgi:hypothetical protein
MNELTVLEHKDIRVLTTEQLAEAYGCGVSQIKQNFNNNKARFIEGKHYFRLEGTELKDFKRYVENIGLPLSKYTSTLYLWTKKGAARHSKMLGTDMAWDVFDELEESYFKQSMTPEEFLLYSAQRLLEHSKAIKATNARIDKVDERLLEVESKQMTIDQCHYTIVGYANLMGIRGMSRNIAARLGRKASSMSKKQGYHIGKEYDAKYGVVNTYHVDILQEVMASGV